ncbi:hypothetical protein [Pseudoalteromonas sp. SR41-6]|uniref:hypothetical protein n=1 Tax=Pseudoalteromonas sp. SR41-6 TaxID=2760948 RepID=UPI0016035D3D|nr:hypothetical protein [Pseudoalteromonas sp. SR41-6]MBB1333968.1 hypothetical protein [Pseudoalteromonas sp. SR41-6]
MKKKNLCFLFLFFSSSNLFAADHCLFNGEKVAVGDSVWVVIPEYVKELTAKLKSKGYSQEAIDKEIRHSDHTGYRLYCKRAYDISNRSGETVDELLKVVSYVLVDDDPYSPLNKK